MAEQDDYYAILGVAPNSEQIVIQAAYRALMRRYHPDTNASPDAAARAQAINEAYAVLSDPDRRARYDRTRLSKKSDGGTAPPPPPPQNEPRASEPDEHLEASRKANRQGLAALGVYAATIAAVGLAIFAAQGSLADASSDNTMNVDNLATENLMVNDTLAIDDAAYAADAAMNAADANMVMAEPVEPERLSALPVAAVEYSNVENAARTVASVFMRDGISGARAYSEDCHRRTTESPSWQSADYCAAFDYAAAAIDQAVTRQAGWPESGYFRFQSQNQADQYAAAGAPSYMTMSRLRQIEGAAASAARDAVSTALARSQAKRKMEEAAQPPSETAEPSNVAAAGEEQRLD
jgi:hypothetical protein